MTPLTDYTSDHRRLVEAAANAAGLTDPLAFTAGGHIHTMVGKARRGPLVAVDGALLRDWHGSRYGWPGTQFGIRLYTLEGLPFARCFVGVDSIHSGYDFLVCSTKDYLKLFQTVLRLEREHEPAGTPPVMTDAQFSVLRQNTIGYLDRDNLQRIRDLGGRPKRGLLLTGPPGNGKTSACRWLRNECMRLGYEHQEVSPDAYQAARRSCNPVQSVKELFTVNRHGIIFFDDMDIALRDRNTVRETDDQAVFLSALDGIEVNEGVVYVFTTNCAVELIDPAFKRPGRIDLVLQFDKPDASLRRTLIERWHEEVRSGIDITLAVEETEGFSFAEVEEVKNLLILRYIESKTWDWNWATNQFRENRAELATKERQVGFVTAAAEPSTNGHSHN